MGSPQENTVLDIQLKYVPEFCGKKAEKKGQLLLHYSCRWSATPHDANTWSAPYEEQLDFTRAAATKMGVGDVLKGWDMAIEGMCEGSKATLTIPPVLAYDGANGKPPRPAAVPPGATVRCEVEIISVLKVDEQGVPFRPCFFSLIDTDDSGYLSLPELERHFKRVNQQVPAHVMNEDTDGDGYISWHEFTGPKHARAPVDEIMDPAAQEPPPGAKPVGKPAPTMKPMAARPGHHPGSKVLPKDEL